MAQFKLNMDEEDQNSNVEESTEAQPLNDFQFFPDQDELTEDQADFIERLENARSNSTGYEQYADFTEFYDEDGAVLLIIEDKDNTLSFNFGDVAFEYKDSDLVKG